MEFKVVFYGCCQTQILASLFESQYGIKPTVIVNFESIQRKENIDPLVQGADLFVYNPLKGKGQYDTDRLINQVLTPNIIKVKLKKRHFNK